ncbi:MAG: CocE/NonD family hydrolase, partial [Mycobacteriales bacterium]
MIGPPGLRSLYVPVADGTRLAVDIWTQRSPAPTVLVASRYWRAFEGQREPAPLLQALRDAGYALLLVDVRGTGASFGAWTCPHARRELLDLSQVLTWAAGQPWCDGRFGAAGTSYSANDAESLAALPGSRLLAVVATSADHDLYHDLVCPGGITATWFIEAWRAAIAALDGIPSATRLPPTFPAQVGVDVRRADEDAAGTLLRAARAEHLANADPLSLLRP